MRPMQIVSSLTVTLAGYGVRGTCDRIANDESPEVLRRHLDKKKVAELITSSSGAPALLQHFCKFVVVWGLLNHAIASLEE